MEKIYGVSSKFNFGQWDHRIRIFDDPKRAKEWLHTEEYDFRERELMTRAEAIQLAGEEAVESAELSEEWS